MSSFHLARHFSSNVADRISMIKIQGKIMGNFIKVFVAGTLLSAAGSLLALEVNQPAPDFTLKSRAGNNLRLDEYKGEVVLLNFWASWCGPCRKEMPYLDDIQQKYSDLGFTVLGVNVDKDSKKADLILKDIPVSFPVLFDPDGKVSEMYDVNAMPITVIIDKDGKIRDIHKGYKAGYEKKYAKQVKALILE
ncbi:Thiol-disulfide oxidoreductase ResA [BD1-7 clade bacterium]|uniref:Thiol-disulfide oxidoreductase ResA n=1 Tax=BD1-7 clade bacterium TaxID=2029982 RepID=A0A5S9P677_9GAMM|nr:Thiol-disulfide oxidoreductase ResA [BD1-7 clade bacterium]CAA0099087.1 Thiol-disulfide oxidoreductase ResA [BD1-7 clade bacterium]